MLWGNYSGFATNTISILNGIMAQSKNAKYIEGAGYTNNNVLISRYSDFVTKDGKPGISGTYYNNVNMKDAPVATATYAAPINLDNGGATVFAPREKLENFSARYEGLYN